MPEARPEGLEIGMLGPFQASGPTGNLKCGSRKERALLAVLALRAEGLVPFARLVEELWENDAPEGAATTVRTLLSRLRRALDEAGAGPILVSRRGLGYRLDIERDRVDVLRFERLLQKSRRSFAVGAMVEGARHLDTALGLWRGLPLEEFTDYPFARAEAGRLEELRLEATEELVEARLSLGQAVDALSLVQRHVDDHPYRERAWGLLMVSLYRLGRQAEALRAFQQLRQILRDGLGIEPSLALRHLERQVLVQHPVLDEPSTHWVGSRPSRAIGDGLAPPGLETYPETDAGALRVVLLADLEASRQSGSGLAREELTVRRGASLTAIASEAGGRVVGRSGAVLQAVFPSASAALSAALATLAAPAVSPDGETTGAPPPPLVETDREPSNGSNGTDALLPRVAIHVGELAITSEGYGGQAVDQASRLLESSHAGQILLTSAAVELVRHQLEPDVRLRDLGEYVVEPGGAPQRVFQAVHGELAPSFPPLRLPGPKRHNLPRRLSHFGGRQRELAEVTTLVGTSHLVTLTGIGGVGKSRLAIEVAGRVLDSFPDGVFLAELAPPFDPDLIGDRLLASIGIRATGPAPDKEVANDELCRLLETRALLLVVDNCEHLIDPVSRILERLLERCPKISVLATSREPLGIRGEVVWSVPPLSLPPEGAGALAELGESDAVALFCEWAKAADPSFRLTEENAEVLGHVCRRLDGIPLALELAAARLRVLTLEQVAQRLDERFRLLVGSARGAIGRHRTLKAAMDWSYQLLTPLERLALRRLSVFPAGFELEAAERVLEDGNSLLRHDVLDVLGDLTDKSLLVVENSGGDKRYRLLETVREYGEERLDEAGETELIRGRHCDVFLELARRYGSGDSRANTGQWLRRFDVEHHNLRVALEWSLTTGAVDSCLEIAGALRIYWLFAGHFAEACHWYERALAQAGPRTTRARIAALNGFGLLVFVHRGDWEHARRLHQEALDSATGIGDALGAATSRFYLGMLSMQNGAVGAAQALLAGARQAFLEEGWPATAAWCEFPLGWIALESDDRVGAENAFTSVLEAGRRSGSDDLIAHALGALGPLAALDADDERAAALVTEAVEVARALALDEILVMTLVRAGEVAVILGRPDQALAALREALALVRGVGVRGWIADCFELLALAREHQGQLRRAARLLGACETLRTSRRERVGEQRWTFAEADRCRARIAREMGAERLAKEWARGSKMTLEEAFFDALEEQHLPGPESA